MFCSSPPSVDALEVTAVEGLKRDSKFEPSPFKKRGKRGEEYIERICICTVHNIVKHTRQYLNYLVVVVLVQRILVD